LGTVGTTVTATSTRKFSFTGVRMRTDTANQTLTVGIRNDYPTVLNKYGASLSGTAKRTITSGTSVVTGFKTSVSGTVSFFKIIGGVPTVQPAVSLGSFCYPSNCATIPSNEIDTSVNTFVPIDDIPQLLANKVCTQLCSACNCANTNTSIPAERLNITWTILLPTANDGLTASASLDYFAGPGTAAALVGQRVRAKVEPNSVVKPGVREGIFKMDIFRDPDVLPDLTTIDQTTLCAGNGDTCHPLTVPLAFQDLDGDGIPDVATGTFENSGAFQCADGNAVVRGTATLLVSDVVQVRDRGNTFVDVPTPPVLTEDSEFTGIDDITTSPGCPE
jgi:hypothetical protein